MHAAIKKTANHPQKPQTNWVIHGHYHSVSHPDLPSAGCFQEWIQRVVAQPQTVEKIHSPCQASSDSLSLHFFLSLSASLRTERRLRPWSLSDCISLRCDLFPGRNEQNTSSHFPGIVLCTFLLSLYTAAPNSIAPTRWGLIYECAHKNRRRRSLPCIATTNSREKLLRWFIIQFSANYYNSSSCTCEVCGEVQLRLVHSGPVVRSVQGLFQRM